MSGHVGCDKKAKVAKQPHDLQVSSRCAPSPEKAGEIANSPCDYVGCCTTPSVRQYPGNVPEEKRTTRRWNHAGASRSKEQEPENRTFRSELCQGKKPVQCRRRDSSRSCLSLILIRVGRCAFV